MIYSVLYSECCSGVEFFTTADELTVLCIDCRHTEANANLCVLNLLFDFSRCPSPLLPASSLDCRDAVNPLFSFTPPILIFSLPNSICAFLHCGRAECVRCYGNFPFSPLAPPPFTHPSTLTHSLFSLQNRETIKSCQQDGIKRKRGRARTREKRKRTSHPGKLKGYLFVSECDRHMLSAA